MKAEMLEKYGIGRRPGRGISSNATSKVKFAADLGLDPTGLNILKRSDSAAHADESKEGGTPVRNKNVNPIKHGLPLRKPGDPLLISKHSADAKIGALRTKTG